MITNSRYRRRDFLASAGGLTAFSFLGISQAGEETSSAPARRVVTGLNATGKSAIVSDGPVPATARYSKPGEESGSDLWLEKSVPVKNLDQTDPMADYSMQAGPPAGGVIVGTATWEPGHSYPMHRTDTIDFLFVISGQIELILEQGSTVLESGDCLVQRGTNHAWRVVGDESCTFAVVLLSAER